MNDRSNQWVVVVYDGLDKVGSRLLKGEEDRTRVEAKDWVSKFYSGLDWSLHRVTCEK